MKLTIEGNAEEIKKLFQVGASDVEQKNNEVMLVEPSRFPVKNALKKYFKTSFSG